VRRRMAQYSSRALLSRSAEVLRSKAMMKRIVYLVVSIIDLLSGGLIGVERHGLGDGLPSVEDAVVAFDDRLDNSGSEYGTVWWIDFTI
jgi:hypothetical protein